MSEKKTKAKKTAVVKWMKSSVPIGNGTGQIAVIGGVEVGVWRVSATRRRWGAFACKYTGVHRNYADRMCFRSARAAKAAALELAKLVAKWGKR